MSVCMYVIPTCFDCRFFFLYVFFQANEFPSLPAKIVNLSDTFSICRKHRSLFVVFIISTLAIATGLNIVSTVFPGRLTLPELILTKQWGCLNYANILENNAN